MELFYTIADAALDGTLPEAHLVALRLAACRATEPVLEQMRLWLQGLKPAVLPKSPLGKAIGYGGSTVKTTSLPSA